MSDKSIIESRRLAYVDALRSVVGWSYEWGGQSPNSGFDCSGLVVWALRKTGLEIQDKSAQSLYEWFHPYKVLPSRAKTGTLFFYWDDKRNLISHVMSVLMVWPNGTLMLCGARGGGSDTNTLDKATRDNAYVDVKMHDHYWQGNFALAVDPFMYESDWRK